MATLTGNSINTSYQGLIKTNDNTALPLNGRVQITDGEGNASVLELGQQEAVITNVILYSGTASIGSDLLNDQFVYAGTQDFTGATVIGLPDAGIQSVVAGTNVTVDNTDPLNPIVSATGGGAAGLVSGTGSDSMKSADALTASPANASGTGSIALGNNARATALDTISLGNAALADSNYSITIGSSAGYSTGVGTNSISIGADSGYQGGSNALMIGGAATGKASGSVALGYGARVDNAGATDSIAIGFGTTITTAITGAVNFNTGTLTPGLTDTVSVKALATVVDSTPTAGGIIMSDAGGTDRRINIDATGALLIDSTPVGGGGGADQAYGQNITPYMSGTTWNIPWALSGYSTTGARPYDTVNEIQWVPFYAKPGEKLLDFYFNIDTAQPGATINVGLYKSYINTIGSQRVLMPEYVATIATGIDASTGGKKLITGLSSIVFPTDSIGGLYWLAVQSDTASVNLSRWSTVIFTGFTINSDVYRMTSLYKSETSFVLPTGQVNLTGAGATTDGQLDFAWRYSI